VKDSSGFLWIATELGINKFDGKKFFNYTPNSHGLPDNSITNMAVIGSHQLFCATSTSGYFIFDSKQGKPKPLSVTFSSFAYKSHKTKFIEGRVYIKSIASDDILIFGLKENRILDTIKMGAAQVYDFDAVENGNIVLVTNQGLKVWRSGTISDYGLMGYNTTRDPVQSFFNMPSSVFFSKRGTLYLYDKFTAAVRDSVKYSTASVPPNKLLVDKEGNVWFSTFYPAGIYQYNPTTKKLLDFSSYLTGSENSAGSIIEDDEKNIWVGTNGSGLYKISPSVFNPLPALRNENVYYAKMNDAGKLLAATRTGLNIVNTATSQMEHIDIDESNNGYIYSVEKAGKKYVVLNNRIDAVKYGKDKTKFHFIRRRSICMLNDTLAVTGGWANTIELVSLAADTIRVIGSRTLSSDDGDGNRINCFMLDSKKLLWCGTDAGLYVFSGSLFCKKIKSKALQNRIIDILEVDDVVYIATQKDLVTYSRGKLNVVSEINNRPIDKINSLCKDRQGSVFLGTLNGMFKIRPNGLSTYFDEDDGLISKEINKLVYNPYSNALLITTNKGICGFDLNRFKYMVKNVPKIHFDKITSTGRIEYNSGVYNLEKRNMNVYFGSICFSHASSISFKWRGDDNPVYHYIYNPSIELAAMTYGRHTIEIYATNDGTNWSKPLVIRFNVKTPYYLTVWFFLASAAFVLLLTWLIFSRRLRKVRKETGVKAELEQKLVLLKYEALNAAINPHFIFNALNSVQHYINTNRNDEASDYLAKFGFLIRQTIENATEHFISINDEIERLKMYMDLERVRFNNGFAYEIKIDSSLNPFKTKIPNMILQPLIENCIVHGFKQIEYQGYIHLQFMKVDQGLLIILEDNGRGLIKAEKIRLQQGDKKKSIALENVKERIRTVPKASIKISDKSFIPNKGTGVFIEITIPSNL
jgi:ligand-binding sensor domain-containing protein